MERAGERTIGKLTKLGQIVDGVEVPFRFANQFLVEDNDRVQRLVIAPKGDHIELALILADLFPEPYWVLLIQLVSGERQPGRYESDRGFTHEQLSRFCREHTEFLEGFGSHHFWIASKESEGLIVYDQHNYLYAYGDLPVLASLLTYRGFTEVESFELPDPHIHFFHPEHAGLQEAFFESCDWRRTELRPEDDPGRDEGPASDLEESWPWAKWLGQMRDNFLPGRRELIASDWTYLRIDRPSWLPLLSRDPLRRVLRDQRKLYRHGSIVWGALVQANLLLFEPGPEDLPAAIAFSTDEDVDASAPALAQVARKLFHAKENEVEDDDWRDIGAKLADEHRRDTQVIVPSKLTWGAPVTMSAVLVARKHLPNRVLSGSVFPLLVAPSISDWVIVLPSRFWPQEFIDRVF